MEIAVQEQKNNKMNRFFKETPRNLLTGDVEICYNP